MRHGACGLTLLLLRRTLAFPFCFRQAAALLFLLAHHLDLLRDAAIGVKRSGLAYI